MLMRVLIALLCVAMYGHATDVVIGRMPDVTWTLLSGEYVASFGGTPPAPIDDGSVLWWEFLNTNNPCDDSSFIGTNTGTLGASAAKPTYVAATGGVSACYSFDGGDKIWRPQISSLTGTGNKSATIWVMGTNSATAISFGNVAGDGGLWQLTMDRAVSYLQVDNGNRAFTTPTRNNGVWYHVAVGHDSANTTSAWAYLNSKTLAVASTAARAINTQSSTNFIGQSMNPAVAAFWTGRLDEPTLYTTNLTAAQVATNFWFGSLTGTVNSASAIAHGWTQWDRDNRNGLYTNLAGHWPMNYSGIAADVSTNGRHAIVSGVTWQGSPSNGWNACDGVSDYAENKTEVTALAATTQGTWSVWLRSIAVADNAQHISMAVNHTNSTAVTRLYIDLDARNANKFILAGCFVDGTQKWATQTAVNSLSTKSNVWMHVCVSHNGTAPRLFVDAVEATAFSVTTDKTIWMKGVCTDATADATSFTLGGLFYNKSWNTSALNGAFDDPMMFTRALTPTEITNLYNDTKGPYQ